MAQYSFGLKDLLLAITYIVFSFGASVVMLRNHGAEDLDVVIVLVCVSTCASVGQLSGRAGKAAAIGLWLAIPIDLAVDLFLIATGALPFP